MFLFGFGNIIYISVLLLNAVAILSEDRFLARVGLSSRSIEPSFGAQIDNSSVKAKLVSLIAGVQTVLRIPLIAVNTIIIIYAMVLG